MKQREEQEVTKTKPERTWNKRLLQKQLIVVTISSIGLYIGFRYFFPLFFPFILAYLLARLILPVVRFLKDKFRIPVVVGSVLSLAVTLGILGSGLFYLGVVLIKQLQLFLRDLPMYAKTIMESLETVCRYFDSLLRVESGTSIQYVQENMVMLWGVVQDVIMPIVSEHTINIVVGFVGLVTLLLIIVIAIINIIMDYEGIRQSYLESNLYQCISPVTSKLSSVGYAYVKTQATIMCINAVLLISGFYFIGNKYAILAGILIAFMDAFPVIGSGLFLVPLAIFKLIWGNYVHAIVIFALYGLCECIRSMIEPRMLGNRIGLKPIFTVMAMYIGVDLFGIAGFIVGPLALVILKTILEETIGKEAREKE